jgi:predicted S18 family serine protease
MAVEIKFGKNAKKESVTSFSLKVLEDILQAAGLNSAVISSTARTPADQARVMFNNLESTSVAAQKKLYAAAGDAVIDEYVKAKSAKKTPNEIKAAMEAKIIAIGPTKVSHHASDPNILCVFDVAPSSIAKKAAFEKAVRADKRVKQFFKPPLDPGYHLEIPQPK